MAAGKRRIRVTEETALAPLLEEAARHPVVLERDGELYQLNRLRAEDDVFASYDPEAALRGIESAAGDWSDIDTEAFKAFLYRARAEGSNPPLQP